MVVVVVLVWCGAGFVVAIVVVVAAVFAVAAVAAADHLNPKHRQPNWQKNSSNLRLSSGQKKHFHHRVQIANNLRRLSFPAGRKHCSRSSRRQ